MDEAREFAGKLNDRTRLIDIILYQSGNEWQDGKSQSAIKLAQEALALAEEMGDTERAGLAKYRLASAALFNGDYAGAADFGVAGAKLLQPVAHTLMRFGGLVQTFVGAFAAIALAELGRFDEAIELGRTVYETAVAENHAYSISVSCFGISHALALRGDIDEALGPLEEGLRQIEIHSRGGNSTLGRRSGRLRVCRTGPVRRFG